jgi:signal transduction histidine kinase
VELEIDPGSFAQVVTNLVLNALIHAFDEREGTMGTVTVSMTREEGDIEIRVGDDGHGISDENLARIFDPFFTTRKGRGGTGLGLHIVHTIVTTQLGGQIRCQSVIGEGTEFVILLPPSM